MATGSVGYIGGAVPHRVVRVSNTTLFHLAAEYLGDATLWYTIARMNGLVDPMITGLAEISLPNTAATSNGGLLGL